MNYIAFMLLKLSIMFSPVPVENIRQASCAVVVAHLHTLHLLANGGLHEGTEYCLPTVKKVQK